MRDMVEIGMGRTARRTYELAEINIVPSRRTRSSQDVTTAWQLDAYRFETPSSPIRPMRWYRRNSPSNSVGSAGWECSTAKG